jgi:hypothetical protein
MHKLALIAALVLAGCGGSDEEDDQVTRYRERALERAEIGCKTNGGLQTIHGEFYSHSKNGSLLDVGLDCECTNGYRFRTLVRRE